ncbi:MAG: DcrB-related protein [Enterobacteriaceae bacterium]
MIRYVRQLCCFLLLLVLAGCDNSDQPVGQTAQERPQGQQVHLLDNKLNLVIPEVLHEQQGASSLTHTYADMTQGRNLVITELSYSTPELIQKQLQSIINTIRQQDSKMQIVQQGAIQAGQLHGEQLVLRYRMDNQDYYSCIVAGLVGEALVHLWFSTQQQDQEAFQPMIEAVLGSITVS